MRRPVLCSLPFVALTLLAAAPGLAQHCVEDLYCMDVLESEDGDGIWDVVLDNLSTDDVVILLDFDTENLAASVPLPHLDRYPAGRETFAFQLRRVDPSAPWNYSSRMRHRPAVEELSCTDDKPCVTTDVTRDSLDLYVTHPYPADLSFGIEVEVRDNATVASEPATPLTVPAGERVLAARLERVDPARFILYRFSTRWRLGRLEAEHDEDYVYALPYAPGESFRVGQGPHTDRSHQNLYAIDWNMPEGTPIHAARGGIVIEVEEDFREGGLTERLKDRANLVAVVHDDGTVGRYLHLAPGGALVEVGDRVERGQKIALSGNTGYSSGPHLHFDVATSTADWERRTFPLRFELTRDRVKELEETRTYRAPRD
jgi:hypothetical protein